MTLNTNPVSFKADVSKSFDVFSQRVIKGVKRGQKIDLQTFSKDLTKFEDSFETDKNILNKKSKNLAETLVSLNKDNMASIVYGFLIRVNNGNIKLAEEFATNALKIAKRLNDPVNIAARANDLKEVYRVFPPKNEKFISILYDEKHALNKIINNYDNIQKQNKNLKAKEDYQLLLADVKFEIGKRHSDKNLARQEFIEAKTIYENLGMTEKTERLNEFLI